MPRSRGSTGVHPILAALGICLGVTPALATSVLNPANPAFTRDGQQSVTLGSVLRLTDTSSSDFIAFFASDADAGLGADVDR